MPITISRLLDALYPAVCHLCSEPLSHGACLCTPCTDSFIPVTDPFCNRCGECYSGDMTGEFICPNCHGLTLHFDFARAAYQECNALSQIIHDFKYGRQIHLARQIASITALTLTNEPRFSTWTNKKILIPVPLHWRRLRTRRFNQAEEIARHISHQSGIPWANALKRQRNTETQTRLSRKKRLENLHGAFAIKNRYLNKIKDHDVILIDDVLTTGSTANECALTLKQQGIKKVAVITVMRG